jgi:hypothetical protein
VGASAVSQTAEAYRNLLKEVSGSKMTDLNKTPNCDMHEALVSHLYNEASPEERRRVEEHLKSCSICAEELTAFERVRGMLQQWQVDELPEVYIVTKDTAARTRSMLALLKELFTVTPVWVKAFGGVAVAMLILAVMGTSVSVGPNGFSMRVSLFNRGVVQPIPADGKADLISAAEVQTIVNAMIADSERHQSETLKAQLVSIESQLQNSHEADLAKVSARIQQQRELIKTLERDIDRREGLALSDILLGEATPRSGGTHGGD